MCDTTTLKSLIYCLISYFTNSLFPLLIGLAFIMFIWGVFKFVRDAGDDTARTKGKKLMFWGIFGLFVMLCVWAFVQILAGTFFNAPVFIPQVRI